MTDPAERKQSLRKAGRCFVCLRKHHTSRDCHSPSKCGNCGGRHHTSICKGGVVQDGARTPVSRQDTGGTTATNPPQQVGHGNRVNNTPTSTATLQSSTTKVPVLLQTAQAPVFKPSNPTTTMNIRLIFDSGSQRSYISEKVEHWIHYILKQ